MFTDNAAIVKNFLRNQGIPALLAGLALSAIGCSGVDDYESLHAAIIGGTEDTTGRYGNVGALVAPQDGQLVALCSGVLIAPQVFATAAHCTEYVVQNAITDVWVSFDPHSVANSSSLLPATVFHNPNFGKSISDPQDLAVLTLSAAPAGITPARLPTAGQFTLANLKGATFTAVGFGAAARNTGNGAGNSFQFDGIRRYATESYRNKHDAWLYLSQNSSQGAGGTCYGDSGGPNFLDGDGVLAGLTIRGDSACNSTNNIYRLDTPNARSFLSSFMTLP